jgi:spore maturation protein CgeB
MKIVLFCHSLLSDWNHGNAHFLRGIVTELAARGHDVTSYEPADAWSVENLVRDRGAGFEVELFRHYPALNIVRYQRDTLSLDEVLDGVDLVLVHEWNEPELVAAIGRHRRSSHYGLLFHDTHHRSVTDVEAMSRFCLDGYDGVLAFGETVRRRYIETGWARQVFTWHEAADSRIFRPRPELPLERDVVWIGNWGDGERTRELSEFLIEPVANEHATASVYGVRYPAEALAELRRAGIVYGGFVPNYLAPEVFARHRLTLHVPRRPYASALPGVPTIRMFEALACGIPLVSAPWFDCESLFREGDYVRVGSGAEMRAALHWLLRDPAARAEIAASGRQTVLARHTCSHRVDELFAICGRLMVAGTSPAASERIATP